jgi:hypothetical protein
MQDSLVDILIAKTENGSLQWYWTNFMYPSFMDNEDIFDTYQAMNGKFKIQQCFGQYTLHQNNTHISPEHFPNPFLYALGLHQKKEKKLFKMARQQSLLRLGFEKKSKIKSKEALALVNL